MLPASADRAKKWREIEPSVMTPTATRIIRRLLTRSARCPPKRENPMNGRNAARPINPSARGSLVIVYSS